MEKVLVKKKTYISDKIFTRKKFVNKTGGVVLITDCFMNGCKYDYLMVDSDIKEEKVRAVISGCELNECYIQGPAVLRFTVMECCEPKSVLDRVLWVVGR